MYFFLQCRIYSRVEIGRIRIQYPEVFGSG